MNNVAHTNYISFPLTSLKEEVESKFKSQEGKSYPTTTRNQTLLDSMYSPKEQIMKRKKVLQMLSNNGENLMSRKSDLPGKKPRCTLSKPLQYSIAG